MNSWACTPILSPHHREKSCTNITSRVMHETEATSLIYVCNRCLFIFKHLNSSFYGGTCLKIQSNHPWYEQRSRESTPQIPPQAWTSLQIGATNVSVWEWEWSGCTHTHTHTLSKALTTMRLVSVCSINPNSLPGAASSWPTFSLGKHQGETERSGAAAT